MHGRSFHVRVWNDTVANLTLMALGSSAPEIILSVIEVTTSEFFAGELGPSTIVGSAAFNLFCIAALCVVAVGKPARTIRYQAVFYVTAIFSIFAYVWLVIILAVRSPNLVEVWEGVITFLFFIVLVVTAYFGDKGWLTMCCTNKKVQVLDTDGDNKNRSAKIAPEIKIEEEKVYMGLVRQIIARDDKKVSSEDIIDILKKIRKTTPDLTNHEAAQILKKKVEEQLGYADQPRRKSKAYYRSQAMKGLSGAATVDVPEPIAMPTINEEVKKKLFRSFTQQQRDNLWVKWSSSSYNVFNASDSGDKPTQVVLTLERGPHLVIKSQTLKVNTIDGAAVQDRDFVPLKDHIVEFEEHQRFAEVVIDIVGDKGFDETEFFFVQISDPEPLCPLKANGQTKVRISTENQPGVLAFKQEKYQVTESERKVVLTVVRKEGCVGEVSVKWKTKQMSACNDTDFVPVKDGLIVFKEGEAEKDISVVIIDDEEYEKDETFLVMLSEPDGGALFYDNHNGGAEEEIANVVIISDEKQKNIVDEMSLFFNINQDRLKIGANNYKEQFLNALYPGGYDKERGCDAKPLTWISHILTCPWRLIFAIIPPPSFCGGVLTFFVALGFIAVLTMFIADLASLAGCCISFKPAFTAITIVALGTSLPDAFASKAAAQGDKHADNSIGNITGSNSVNVFLGLGLPWCIASIYWASVAIDGDAAKQWEVAYRDVPEAMAWQKEHNGQLIFVVPAGNLWFGVTLFCIGAFVTLGMLEVRRHTPCCGNGELGGPTMTKWMTFALFVGIWIMYLTLSGLNIYEIILKPEKS